MMVRSQKAGSDRLGIDCFGRRRLIIMGESCCGMAAQLLVKVFRRRLYYKH